MAKDSNPPYPDLLYLANRLLDRAYSELKADRFNDRALKQITKIRALLVIPLRYDLCRTGPDFAKLALEVREAYDQLLEMERKDGKKGESPH